MPAFFFYFLKSKHHLFDSTLSIYFMLHSGDIEMIPKYSPRSHGAYISVGNTGFEQIVTGEMTEMKKK